MPRYLRLISCFRSWLRGNRRPHARVLLNRSHPLSSGLLTSGRLWFSQVPREPQCACALLLDSAGALMPSLDGISVLPPNRQTRRASGFSSFEAQSHSLSTRCLRFMPPSRTTMQNSLPVLASFSVWDCSLPTEFRWAVSASRLPPPLSLSWRDCRTLCRRMAIR